MVFALIFILTIYLRLYLSFFGFGNLVVLLKKNRANLLYLSQIKTVSKSINLASSFIPNITCLIKASVIKIIFNNVDELKLIIGINTNKDKLFESHAWVVFKNKIILNNDMKIDEYKVIYTI